MLNRNRAVASLGLAIAFFGWIAVSCGQQTPDASSASPPPPISFGASSALEVDARSTQSSPADSVNAKQPSRSSPSIFGKSKRQTLEPLQPSIQYEPAVRESEDQDSPDSASFNSSLYWAAQSTADTAAEQNAGGTTLDPLVQPATHLEFEPGPPISPAGLVLQTFDVGQWNDALPGQPRSITELLAATDIESRPVLIRSYWAVFEKWARRVTAHIESEQLAELRTPDSAIERDMIGTANSLAKARVIESEMEMETAQQLLAQFVPRGSNEVLPLANDLPLVDEYVTRHAEWGKHFGFNARLDQINQSLPKSLQIIQARADASTKCRQVVQQAIQAFNQNQLPLGNAIEAIRMFRESQQDFIRAVNRYNQDIAEYALTVAPFGQAAEQVVAMLIKQPNSPAAETPTIARQPQDFPSSTYSPSAGTNPGNTLRTANSESSKLWNEAPSISPLAAPKARAEFGTSAAPQQQARATQAQNLGTSAPASSVQITNPPSSQPLRSPPINKPSSLQSGGGSFSFGKR